ncbi:MAG: hypothetical protein U0527_07565 [Candidatus Eisenbacteria bacterium]
MTCPTDMVAPARVLEQFIAETKSKVKAACVEGKLYDEAAVGALAKLPTREVPRL